jgi:membrane protease YdiL (CAAX protease family)
MTSAQPQNAASSGWARKTAALLEVLGLFVGGSFAASWLAPRLGIPFPNLGDPDPDFVVLSGAWLKFLLLQYACLLGPAFGLGWWRRRLKPRDYGVTRANQRTGALIGEGLVAFALVVLPFKLFLLVHHFVPLGPEPPMWEFIGRTAWTPAFWLFIAVSSCVVTPMLEELFFRGYCQTRLEEDFGGMGAIVIVSLFMILGHKQYHHLNVLSIGTIAVGGLAVFGMGWVYWRTRSLLPAMVLHGAINLPTTGVWDVILPAAMILALFLFRGKWRSMIREFAEQAANKDWKRAALVGTVVAVAFVIGFETWATVFVSIACCGLVAALLIEIRQRRRSCDRPQLFPAPERRAGTP